jgi:putative glutamine amidotransferase
MTQLVAVTVGRDAAESGEERVGVPAAYVRALTRAGLVPVLVPPLVAPAAACALLDRVHGLVLTGGEDVAPARYGAAAHPRLGETDPDRDAVELALVAGAMRRRLPILAICRGLQILNVALGGTLYQDLPSERPGPLAHDDGAGRHAITIEPGSLLARALAATRALVNTRHHQAVRDLAPALRATAWAEDGVLEAAESRDPGAWVLAVQWHPEDEPDDRLFRGFAGALG